MSHAYKSIFCNKKRFSVYALNFYHNLHKHNWVKKKGKTITSSWRKNRCSYELWNRCKQRRRVPCAGRKAEQESCINNQLLILLLMV